MYNTPVASCRSCASVRRKILLGTSLQAGGHLHDDLIIAAYAIIDTIMRRAGQRSHGAAHGSAATAPTVATVAAR